MSKNTHISEWLSFLFAVGLVSYVAAVFLELAFPGFVAAVIHLDYFLWLVILLGVLRIGFKKLFGTT